jgi:ParB family chromosome partitioning protein
MKRKALGRGLSALLSEPGTATTPAVEHKETGDATGVPLALIDPNPFQPRRTFPEDSLNELAESIRSTGVVQPVLLRPVGERFQLVAGERRLRAARLAAIEAIPAVIRELSDEGALEIALTENLLREDLNPLEVAQAYRTLQEKFHLSHQDIADRLGINRTTVTNSLRLLNLPERIQDMLAAGELTSGHARCLLALETVPSQVQMAALIAKRGLSVRQVEDMIAGRGTAEKEQPGKTNEKRTDPNIRAAMLEMERTLGTRVRIVGSGTRGKIEISYFSAEDLNRIYDIITKGVFTK